MQFHDLFTLTLLLLCRYSLTFIVWAETSYNLETNTYLLCVQNEMGALDDKTVEFSVISHVITNIWTFTCRQHSTSLTARSQTKVTHKSFATILCTFWTCVALFISNSAWSVSVILSVGLIVFTCGGAQSLNILQTNLNLTNWPGLKIFKTALKNS